MSCRTGRFELVRRFMRAALRWPAARAGFTLIEVLVAIAVLAVLLGAVGAVVGTTVKGIRSVDRRLPLLETAQNLLASLPDRAGLQPGTQSGAAGDFRWRIDVVALAAPAPAKPLSGVAASNFSGFGGAAPDASAASGPPPKWMPVAITVRVQGREGPPLRLDTVRLIPRPAG